MADKGNVLHQAKDAPHEVMRQVLRLESAALCRAADRLTPAKAGALVGLFAELTSLGGGLVFCGVGKSGQIALKLASTFSSLGLPGRFLHPVEALHGDLGALGSGDALVLLSKSGTTEEIFKLLPYLEIEKTRRVGLLGNPASPLAEEVGIVLDCSVEKEACLNNQAPTASSTLALAMGDAMAVLYEHTIGLSREGFALNHPGGWLGKSLRIKVEHLMIPAGQVPAVSRRALLKEAIIEMTRFPVGACAVLAGKEKLLGIVVEGDIRRSLGQDDLALAKPVEEIMNPEPVFTEPDQLAYEALLLMENKKRPISVLPVLGQGRAFLGFLRLHDLLKEGLVSN